MITRLSVKQPQVVATQIDDHRQATNNKTTATAREHLFDSLSPTTQLSESPTNSSLNTNSESSVDLSHNSMMTRQSQNGIIGGAGAGHMVGQNSSQSSSPRSPILIKYNYYDYNGSRQEQPNQDMRNHQQQQQQQHEQQTHNSSSFKAAAAIQRQLSPTFKQNLDQIVRNSQLVMRNSGSSSHSGNSVAGSNKNGSTSSSVSSPSPISPGAISSSTGSTSNPSPDQATMQGIHFARRYQLSSYEQRCLRCNKTVYQMDKVGPLKEFTFYHQNCFKCRECGTKLTLRTYFNNQQFSADLEVYCHRHCPKTGPGKLDNQSVGIRAALNAPKVFDSSLAAMFREDLLQPGASVANCNSAPNYNSNTINARLLPAASQRWLSEQSAAAYLQQQQHQHQQQPQVDGRALYIQHAVQQTKLQNIYKQSQVDKKISQFLERRLEYLEPKQKLLEMRHREEEDALFKAFELKWRQEEKSISEQIRDEWQIELNKLLEKYKRQLSSIQVVDHSTAAANSSKLAVELTNNFNKAAAELPRQIQQSRSSSSSSSAAAAAAAAAAAIEQNNNNNGNGNGNSKQMIEYERLNLEKTMTIKLDRKKETLKRKLKEFERQATAELVEKQSREMLALISMKLDEYKEEQKRKIGSDLEHFEAIEKLANRLAGSSLSSPPAPSGDVNNQPSKRSQQVKAVKSSSGSSKSRASGDLGGGKFETPPPEAPKVSKMELYNYEEPDEVFRDIDQLAINVAKEDQQTFTDLVHHLTRNCLTDVEKVRAIFRWITVKNLNTMQFDSSVKADTPLGLLRGIKNGSESYHVLFKRLCSYAGLHCVVIKGYSKSAGYQPGIRFEGNRFRNSWNAVYVAGAWRFVQCNWGARHLVSVAIMQDKNNQPTNNGAGPANSSLDSSSAARLALAKQQHPQHPQQQLLINAGRSHQHHSGHRSNGGIMLQQQQQQSPNHGRRGLLLPQQHNSSSSSASCSSASSSLSSLSAAFNNLSSSSHNNNRQHQHHQAGGVRSPAVSPAAAAASTTVTTAAASKTNNTAANDSLRYEYDDHYFLTDPDEFIYEFYPISPEWQLLRSRPIALGEFEQLPFVRSLFFKYGLYFPQHDIRSVLQTDSSGATTIKIGMPTHMVPSLIFHYNLKYYDSDLEHHDGVSLKRFVMQSVESGSHGDAGSPSSDGRLSNVVSFRVHLPENGAYILDIFANSTTPNQYITGEPMKFKSVCKFKIVAKQLKTVMIPLPDCASGEYGPMKATRLFGIIPITHENALISVQNDKRFLEIQFRMTRPLVDFMASLHKNNYDEKQLSKAIKIFVDGDIVIVTVKFFEDGQYGLDIYTRDQSVINHPMPVPTLASSPLLAASDQPKKQLLTHCCKYLINVRTPPPIQDR